MLISGGTIIDGTKATRKKADIRIIDRKIKEIGNLKPRGGEEVLQARGKFIAPGFIGFFEHKNLEPHFFSHATQEHIVRQGVTTMLVGAGGASLAPLINPNIHININWRTVGEYLATLSSLKPKCNIGTLIGYDTVSDAGTPEQISYVISQGLLEGAFGISFSTNSKNNKIVRDIIKKHSIVVQIGPSPNPSFPQFLQHDVREKKLLSWEEAIYQITGKVAEEAKIKNRGKISLGYYGDIVVFDPMHISDTQGISRVLVNGGSSGDILKHT